MHFDKPTYTVKRTSRKDIPKGLYTKDPVTGEILFNREIEDNLMVVPKSGHHFPLPARQRLLRLMDEGTWAEMDGALKASDPLDFVDSQPYPDRLKRYERESGLPEAVISGTGAIHGIRVAAAAMDFRFCGGAMGAAAGEKITRIIETALGEKTPCIIFSASGGARMQEGIYSLMQMAKTSAALGRLSAAGLPFISVLTHPTMGGVTASFATLGDVILAEPGALIGFAGARVIRDTTKQTLPSGFQTAEFLLKHGLIDQIVNRLEMRDRLAVILRALHVKTEVTALSDYPAVQEYLFGLKAGGVKFGIDRMRLLAERIGHPERAVPVVHVAGTNGKGSVSAMIEAILRAGGRRVGLYTSPHLVRLGERVQVDRQPLTEAQIMEFVVRLQPIADELGGKDASDRPSFFEFMTAMAFLQFQRARCDAAVIEVGMGGRLDATNVVEPEVTVITSLGLDHIEVLGNTLEAIAAEKAGILKAGRPVIMGRLPPAAESVVRRRAQELSSPVISVREAFGEDLGRYPRTNLAGDYQRANAATAILAAGALPQALRVEPRIAERALLGVEWAGRWQTLRLKDRSVILDASHNPEGAGTLDVNLRELRRRTGRSPVIVTGALGAFRARALLEVVARHAREIRLVVPRQARASSYEELEGLVPGTFGGRVVRDTVEALFPGPGLCAAGEAGETVVVTGSIYLLGEVLARLEPQRGPGEGRLQDF